MPEKCLTAVHPGIDATLESGKDGIMPNFGGVRASPTHSAPDGAEELQF